METTKKAGATVLVSDKIDKHCNKKQRRALQNDKGINPVRIFNV